MHGSGVPLPVSEHQAALAVQIKNECFDTGIVKEYFDAANELYARPMCNYRRAEFARAKAEYDAMLKECE